MKFLIIGLGNPGLEYEKTRHNVGFRVLEKLAVNTSFSTERYAEVAEIKHKGRKLILVKPNTFMNLSGKAVHYWLKKTKVPLENLLVITDDISLPFGSLRLRKKGSDGGHNGLRDIQMILGKNTYARLRFGVGNDFEKGFQSAYVLADFNDSDSKILEERIDKSVEIVQVFSTNGIDRAMSEFNGK